MSLVEHAKQELDLVGLTDPKSDYNGMIGKCVLELMEVFAKQGHSGGSAALTIHTFTKLAKYECLSAPTSDPAEWTEVQGGIWQSKRCPHYFSKDQGKHYINLQDMQVRSCETPPAPK